MNGGDMTTATTNNPSAISSPSSLDGMMGGGDMTTATTNNPSSSLGLSSDQLNSLALAPSLTELLDVSNAMQSNFESGETSGFGSLPLVTFPDGNSLTTCEAFEMRSSNELVGALVMEMITTVGPIIWEALMKNEKIGNFLKTGVINISQQLGCTASESASIDDKKGKGTCAIIWQMLKEFPMRDMIKRFMDQLFLGRGGSGGGGSIELNEESRIRPLQISLAVSIITYLGVLAARLMHMVQPMV